MKLLSRQLTISVLQLTGYYFFPLIDFAGLLVAFSNLFVTLILAVVLFLSEFLVRRGWANSVDPVPLASYNLFHLIVYIW